MLKPFKRNTYWLQAIEDLCAWRDAACRQITGTTSFSRGPKRIHAFFTATPVRNRRQRRSGGYALPQSFHIGCVIISLVTLVVAGSTVRSPRLA